MRGIPKSLSMRSKGQSSIPPQGPPSQAAYGREQDYAEDGYERAPPMPPQQGQYPPQQGQYPPHMAAQGPPPPMYADGPSPYAPDARGAPPPPRGAPRPQRNGSGQQQQQRSSRSNGTAPQHAQSPRMAASSPSPARHQQYQPVVGEPAVLGAGAFDRDWDFRLPDLPPPSARLSLKGNQPFNFKALVGSLLARTFNMDQAKQYVGNYEEDEMKRAVCEPLCGFPSIFYAVASNNPQLLRMWVKYGADVHTVHPGTGAPLVAFAVFNCDNVHTHTTKMVATLMSMGAHHTAFPRGFYTPFNKDLPEDGPADDDGPEDPDSDLPRESDVPEIAARQAWCRTPAVRRRLAGTLNLTQRYFLHRAATIKPPTSRQMQVAAVKGAKDMLGIQYFLIGQTHAGQALRSSLLNYLALPSKRPLVLCFAGPSGHGKTELSRQMGELLNLPMEVVDCTIMNKETDLFGARHPYKGAEAGTPFNNFLANNNGKPCIMFMDEFEKTTEEIHKALLIPFDSGHYQDRRNLKDIDCRKTIWILATNELDGVIRKFWKEDGGEVLKNKEREDEVPVVMKALEKNLKARFMHRFKPPLTGRITSFVPFLPFLPPEQAVIAHKCILDLIDRARKPIVMIDPDTAAGAALPGGDDDYDEETGTSSKKAPKEDGPTEDGIQLLGNVELVVRQDATVCAQLARDGYHANLGVRSLIMATRHMVEEPLVEAFLEEEGEIDGEDGVLTQFEISVVRDVIMVNKVDEGRAENDYVVGEGEYDE